MKEQVSVLAFLRSAVRALLVSLLPGVVGTAAAATITVNPGDNLNQKLQDAADGDTVNVNAGTYSALATTVFPAGAFRIVHALTVKAIGAVTLQGSVSPNTHAVLIVSASYNPGSGTVNAIPNGAVLDGFTVSGSPGGVLVRDLVNLNGGTLTNVTLRNLTINTTFNDAAGTHGIEFEGVQDSVIDTCTVVKARQNGIYLASLNTNGTNPSSNNIIMNSTVQGTVVQNGIAIQSSDGNVVVGNTISGVAFDGILLNRIAPGAPGCRFSRIERNNISLFGGTTGADGITATDGSSFNYIAHNVIVSPAYDPLTKPTPSPDKGSGIWLNNGSNGNYVFLNDVKGSPETGLPIFMSSNNYQHANLTHGNFQGGAFIVDDANFSDAGAAAPANNVFHNNYGYFNTNVSQLILRGSSNNDVAYNFLTGSNAFAGPLAGAGTGGVTLDRASGNRVYENIVTDVDTRVYVFADTTTSSLFRNRFLNGSNDPNAAAGKRGLTYSISPATVTWDVSLGSASGTAAAAGPGRTGGNHWSDFAAAGNPSPVTPYTGFIYDAVSGIDGKGPYRDKFPYKLETLGQTYAVSVLEPAAGQLIAAGSRKTIRWQATGCVMVDLYYKPGSGSATLIAQNYPNTGFYGWSVPSSLAAANDYTIHIDCKDSTAGLPAVSDDSSNFTVGTSALILLNPGRASRAANQSTLRVAWKKSTAVTAGVNIFVGTLGSSETQVGTNVGGTFANVTLPASANNSNNIYVRIQASNNANQQDAIDGTMMVRGTSTLGLTTSVGGQTLTIGTIQPLRWVGHSGAYTVDIDLLEGSTVVQQVAQKLPDFGNYTWWVPEFWSSSSTLRLTFKDAAGATVATSTTAPFKVFYTTTPGVRVTRYRLNSDVTKEHLFTTDENEYNVLSGLAPTWTAEGPDHEIFNGPNNTGGVEAVPYYRLYGKTTRWHLWTTDRNEYFTLRGFPELYDAEGVDGYIFPTQVSSTIRFDRLLFAPINGLHHWTRDQNERSTLKAGGAWIDDALDGFVFCPSGATPRPCP